MRSKHSKSFILTKKLRSYWFYQSSTFTANQIFIWEHWLRTKSYQVIYENIGFETTLMCSMQFLKAVVKCKVVFKSLVCLYEFDVVTSHMQILSKPIIVLYVVVSLFFLQVDNNKKSFLKIKNLTHKSHPYINRWFSERKKCKTIFTSHLSYIYLIFPSC